MYQLSVFIHLLAALIWAGGMLFLALVIVPIARRQPPASRAELLGAVGRRFRNVGWLAIAVLVLTGLLNAGFRGLTWEAASSGQLLSSSFGQLLVAKIALVVVLIGLSALHDFVLGPASVRALERGRAAADEASRLRRRASWLGRLNTILALLAVLIGVLLVRGLPN